MKHRSFDYDPAFEVFKWAVAVMACCAAVFLLLGLGALIGHMLGFVGK